VDAGVADGSSGGQIATRDRDARQIERIVGLVREVLGEDAVGAYLHGSTALDQLRPHSDIDVLVVSRRPTTPDDKRALIDRLLRISGRGDPSGDARPIELTIVVESDIRPWRYPPRLDFLYGDWLRAEFEGGDPTPWETPNPDLAPVITMVRSGNRALFGPPPAEYFDPVPLEDLNRAIVEGIPGLLGDLDSDTTNVVLTFARIWTTLATGSIRSKDGAADWALGRLPEEHRPVLARARAVYLGGAEDTWGDLEVRLRPHVEHVLGEIERLRPAKRAKNR
jgi:predicted nucleotidyltransferase